MNKIFSFLFIVIGITSFAQETIKPIVSLPNAGVYNLNKANGNIDSTFQGYTYTNINLPVRDDFSTNKFVKYTNNFSGPNVTSTQYFKLMDASNTTPLAANVMLCDSTHSNHKTVVINLGIISTNIDYTNTAVQVHVNDLNNYPVIGNTINLYNECYILIDSVIDGVTNPTQDTVWYNNPADYTQDSVRVFFDVKSDPNNIWIDDFVCHNYNYATNPWSLGVATFDGVSNDGYPYEWGSVNNYGNADVLTSKPINLAGKTNVYLTFLYQAKGLGNSPDQLDSLYLEFYAPAEDKWYPTNDFKVDGNEPDNVWKLKHIPITQSVLLLDGFKFRFRNKATLSGVLDHWHIDYVNLRDNSYLGDTIIDDIAIMEPINSLLIDYTSVPWDHYSNLTNPNTVMKASYDLKVRNNHTSAKLQNNGGLTINGTFFNLPTTSPNWQLGVNQYNFGVASQPYVFPQTVLGDSMASFNVKVNVSTSSTNVYNINDTTYFTQHFKNYYAYDDGSAETAYGVGVNNARVAYKFEAYEADTLTGVLMKFVPTNVNVTNEIFLLTIWTDDNGEPGDIIYQDNFFSPHYPIYSGKKNSTKYYTFNNGQFVKVPKTFYVGWEQINNEVLYIGMDLNNDNADKIFYNPGGSWNNTAYTGSLMIRPVFSTKLNSTLSISKNKEKLSKVNMYPNPAKNRLTISGLVNGDIVYIYDMSGRLVVKNNNQITNISELKTGVYIVKVLNQFNELVFSDKLIKY